MVAIHWRTLSLAALLCGTGGTYAAYGPLQDPPSGAVEQQGELPLDPFATPPELFGVGGPEPSQAMASITLRGYARRADGEARALLDLGDRSSIIVRQGDRIQVGSPGGSVLLEVVDLSKSVVHLAPVSGGPELWLR